MDDLAMLMLVQRVQNLKADLDAFVYSPTDEGELDRLAHVIDDANYEIYGLIKYIKEEGLTLV